MLQDQLSKLKDGLYNIYPSTLNKFFFQKEKIVDVNPCDWYPIIFYYSPAYYQNLEFNITETSQGFITFILILFNY